MRKDSDDEYDRYANKRKGQGGHSTPEENISSSEDRHQAPSHLEPLSMTQHYRLNHDKSYEQEFLSPDPQEQPRHTEGEQRGLDEEYSQMGNIANDENVALTGDRQEMTRRSPTEKPNYPQEKQSAKSNPDHYKVYDTDLSKGFSLDPNALPEIVEKTRPRKTPSEEIDALQEQGGFHLFESSQTFIFLNLEMEMAKWKSLFAVVV